MGRGLKQQVFAKALKNNGFSYGCLGRYRVGLRRRPLDPLEKAKDFVELQRR